MCAATHAGWGGAGEGVGGGGVGEVAGGVRGGIWVLGWDAGEGSYSR